MLEKIRAYSQKSKEITSPPVAAASVDLAAIVVYPSRLLWCAQLVVCVAMLLFAFVALFPFFKQAFYWLMLWLVFVLAVGVALRYCHHLKNAAPMSFQIKQQRCLLTTHRGIYAVTIDGDVLLWSWLVIIPLRENLTGKQHVLIALPDSLSASEWRILRVWLKTCLQQLA